MSTRLFSSIAGRVLVGGACLLMSASCGSEMLRTGRSPMLLVIDDITATAGGAGAESSFLRSDVETLIDVTINGVTVKVPTTFDDVASATIHVVAKNQDAATSPLNTVTLTRYHIDFRRTDGRNTPGVDVPYGFDGGLGISILPNASVGVGFEIVRHTSKIEPPLRQLRNFGGLGFINTIAEITFYGRDQNGNEVSVTGRIDVIFGDFADE